MLIKHGTFLGFIVEQVIKGFDLMHKKLIQCKNAQIQ